MRSEILSSIEHVLAHEPGWAVIHSSLAKLAPIYSFVVIGSGAVEMLNCKNQTTFGESSPFRIV
jgi:aminoglycoside N3'-acetyltransferase